jgi:hypothetical protein
MKKWHWIALGNFNSSFTNSRIYFFADYPKEHWWSYVPAFYILWGFVGCVGIIYIQMAW